MQEESVRPESIGDLHTQVLHTLVSLWLQVSGFFTPISIPILMTYRLGCIFGEYP